MTTARKTTRLGKTVGSYYTPLKAFTYWPERDIQTGAAGFIVVAPSGARTKWFADETEAQREVARQNEQW